MAKVDLEGRTELPALTLRQPWAALVAGGAKRFEDRTWKLPLELPALCVIHAGAKRPTAAGLDEARRTVSTWKKSGQRKALRVLDNRGGGECGDTTCDNAP